MELGALILAALQLVLALLEQRRATRPQREAKAERKDAREDLDGLYTGLRDKDPGAVAEFFERERLEAWGRLGPARPDGERLPGEDGRTHGRSDD